MVRKRLFRRLSSLVQRRATVVGDSVKIEAIHLRHSAASVSVGGCICISVLAGSSFLWSTPARAQLREVPPLTPVTYAQSADGIDATIGSENLHISVCRPDVIHIVAALEPSTGDRGNSPWMLDVKDSCPGAKFGVSRQADTVLLTTDTLKVELSLKWGSIQFISSGNDNLLRERTSIPRTYKPVDLNGEKTFHVEDRFSPDFGEGFYGLGQHHSGMFNYRGSTVELGQNNTDVAIPLLLSSKGYALLWNTASLTYVDSRFPLELNLDSLAGHSIDYYFIYGPEHDYESVAHSVIPLHWSQATRTLTTSDQEGSYSKMRAKIQINTVWVSAGHGSGVDPVASPDNAVEYTGRAISVQAP
jgi:Domain of unknown function (DUF4968)